MFTKYFASGARHFLAYDGDTLVSHAVVSTRGVQPEGLPILRTAFVDAMGTATVIAAAIAFLGALLALAFLPARETRTQAEIDAAFAHDLEIEEEPVAVA